MEFWQAFDLTLKKFNIKASALSEVSGVAETDISKFRNLKQDIGSLKMSKLVKALNPTARQYFWMLFNADEDYDFLQAS